MDNLENIREIRKDSNIEDLVVGEKVFLVGISSDMQEEAGIVTHINSSLCRNIEKILELTNQTQYQSFTVAVKNETYDAVKGHNLEIELREYELDLFKFPISKNPNPKGEWYQCGGANLAQFMSHVGEHPEFAKYRKILEDAEFSYSLSEEL